MRVDRGHNVIGGLATLVAFVGTGETLQQAFEAAQMSDDFQERLKVRLKKGPAAKR